MKVHISIIIVTFFLSVQNVLGQIEKQSVEYPVKEMVKPIALMNGLSKNFWEKERLVYQNGKLTMQTLSDSKDKLLILHFWAPWCGPCIKKFPLMDTLQKKYPNQLSIVLVNGTISENKFAAIETTFNRQKESNPQFSLPSIIEDITLHWLFPQRTIGAYIWILDGNVIATTFSEMINEISIQAVLKEREKEILEQKRRAELKKASKEKL